MTEREISVEIREPALGTYDHALKVRAEIDRAYSRIQRLIVTAAQIRGQRHD